MTIDRSASQVIFRRAGDADVEEQHAVFVAAEGELLQRHGFAWPNPPGVDDVAPTYRHLMRHDGERCFVAEVDGRVVGYSAAFVRDDTAFLAALFIDPAHQGIGVGRRLLELALAHAPKRQATISDSIQPVSNALYAKHGLFPATPILAFQGPAHLDVASDLEPADVTPDALAKLDRESYGFDRSIDHAFWATRARPTLWLDRGQPVAYSYRWTSGRIGPLAGRDGEGAAAALVAELARGTNNTVQIPGTSVSLVRVAIEARLRLLAPPGLLLLTDGMAPPRSLAISSYGLC